ncbi:MAG: type II toxin-antitoxin system RelE/ParE family toxin [Clostridiales bacterium]|nr:type II toxin-antitoxin system RelE/ParE family toxin [Clostridiales bacterium]
MYNIYFYKDRNGKEPIKEYIEELSKRNNKDSRIKFAKIREYINILSQYGTRAGEPYIKHLEDDIWELRPLRDRVLFAAWNGKGFVLFHQFVKQTQKTPKREIERAKRNLEDYRERSVDSGEE